MSLNAAGVIAEVASLVRECTGMERVFDASANGDDRLPLALNAFPCALVFPGPGLPPLFTQPRVSRTYEVRILIVESGMDIGARGASVLPFVDRVIAKLVSNMKLAGGGSATATVIKCLVDRDSGFIGIEYGGMDYLGYEITLRVEEQTTIDAQPGS